MVHGYKGTFESFIRDFLFNFEKEPLQGWKLELVASMIHNNFLEGSFEYDSFSQDYSYGYPIDYDAEKASSILVSMMRDLSGK